MQTTGSKNPGLEQALAALAEFRVISPVLPEFARGGDARRAVPLILAVSACIERQRELLSSPLRRDPDLASAMKLLLRDYLTTEAQASLN
jgi:hypothetical protein